MDVFCRNGSGSQAEGNYSPCRAHFINMLAALATSYVSMLLLICLRYSTPTCSPAGRQSRLLQWLRPLLSIGLLLSLLGELAESLLVLSSPASVSGPSALLPLAAASSSVFLWLLSEVLQAHLVSRQCSLHYLHPLVALFNAGLAATRCLSVVSMLWWGSANLDHVRPLFEFSTAVFYLLIALVHLTFYVTWLRDSFEICGEPGDESEEFSYASYQYDSSNLFSKITFSWILPLLQLGNTSPLELEDLGQIPTTESTLFHFRKFADIYNSLKSKKGSNVSLWICYILHSWQMFTLSGFLKLSGDLVGFVGPLGISVIVRYAERTSSLEESLNISHNHIKLYATNVEFFSNGYIMGVFLFLATVAQGTFSQNSTHIINVEGIRIKAALQAMIYDKSLRMPLWKLTESTDQDEKEKTPLFQSKSASLQSQTDKADNPRDRCSQPALLSPMTSPIDTGSIANFMSEDTFNVMSFIWISHYVWAIPVKVGVLMFLLHHRLGLSALVGGILCVVIMTPLQFIIGKRMSSNSKEISEASDERLRRINEVLHGIKVIKLSGWEDLHDIHVQRARNRELRLLNHDSLHWALMTFLTHASSTVVTLVTFGVYMLLENSPLPTADVFSGLALFNQLTVPLFIFPITVPIIINAMVSTRRLETYLSQPEVALLPTLPSSTVDNALKSSTDRCLQSKGFEQIPEHVGEDFCWYHESRGQELCQISISSDTWEDTLVHTVSGKDVPQQSTEEAMRGKRSALSITNSSQETEILIRIQGASFSWQNGGSLLLPDISIPQGKMTLIMGAVGSGKSSFLHALLGEMTSLSGDSAIQWNLKTRIAYCSQKPWLLNTSVRGNILFGETYQRRNYNRVIAACALQPDLDILPLQDMTEIGERGISLSGGQKHRVSIARALYSKADIVFMDDPLSALDYQVGQHLVQEGFKKLLIQRGRTLVLATHCLQLLTVADHIIVMEHGTVMAQGSLASIQTTRPDLVQAWQQAMTVTPDDCSSSGTLNPLGVRGEKTARERWQLVRIVSRFGLQQPSHVEDQSFRSTPHYKALSRRQSRSKYTSHNYSYNFPVPVEECISRVDDCAHGEVSCISERDWEKPLRRTKSTMASGSDVWRRRSTRYHRRVTRVSSLQPRDFGRTRGSPTYAWSYPVNIESLKSASREKPTNSLPKALPESLVEPHLQKSERVTVTAAQRGPSPQKLTSDELKRSADRNFSEEKCGEISRFVYFSYLKSCSGTVCIAYVVSTFAWQGLRVYTDFWLSDWTGYRDPKILDDRSLFQTEMLRYLFVYSLLSIGTILLSLTSNLVGQLAGAKARCALHRQLLANLLHCPIKFFDTTPIGRLIDCFSADTAIVDKKLASSIQRLMQFLSLCGSAILVNTILSPWFLLPALPMCVAYYTVQHFYRVSSRELHRMDSLTRTPILSYFTETLGGLSTIRAYDQQSRFKKEMLGKMDTHNNISLMLCAANRWLGIALDYLGGAIVLVSIIGSLLAAQFHPSVVTPSLVGLAVNYTLLVPIYLNWVVKFLADVEMYMSSVERINHYGNMPEEDYCGQGLQVSPTWPEKGDIIFKDVTLQYDDTREPVITKLNLQIPAGQKVGLCGRTGSGKSSLVMALFRMLDVKQGSILMDGVDISQLPLPVLRSRLSIIPQDVVMFSGTVRLNLDPHNMYSEEEIWNSLDLAQLKTVVQKLPGCLDATVKEGGENFSVGTRQLFCLARAILHNAAVLIMDEATSSVDPTTEQALLSAALRAFAHRTVIIIAHRLSTILDCDRVLVLDAGTIIEDGHPSQLLRCDNGVFTLLLSSEAHGTK